MPSASRARRAATSHERVKVDWLACPFNQGLLSIGLILQLICMCGGVILERFKMTLLLLSMTFFIEEMFKSNEILRQTNTPRSKRGRLESKSPWKYPPLTSISGISEPHQSELYQLPTDLPVAKDGRKTFSLHQSPIFCFQAPVFSWSAAPWKIISQERLASIQGIIDIYSSDLLQIKMRK